MAFMWVGWSMKRDRSIGELSFLNFFVVVFLHLFVICVQSRKLKALLAGCIFALLCFRSVVFLHIFVFVLSYFCLVGVASREPEALLASCCLGGSV